MIQDQSLFTVGTPATLKANMVAANKFTPSHANAMQRPGAPMQARNMAAHISMKANNQNVSMPA